MTTGTATALDRIKTVFVLKFITGDDCVSNTAIVEVVPRMVTTVAVTNELIKAALLS
jgi:hypothetical protein